MPRVLLTCLLLLLTACTPRTHQPLPVPLGLGYGTTKDEVLAKLGEPVSSGQEHRQALRYEYEAATGLQLELHFHAWDSRFIRLRLTWLDSSVPPPDALRTELQAKGLDPAVLDLFGQTPQGIAQRFGPTMDDPPNDSPGNWQHLQDDVFCQIAFTSQPSPPDTQPPRSHEVIFGYTYEDLGRLSEYRNTLVRGGELGDPRSRPEVCGLRLGMSPDECAAVWGAPGEVRDQPELVWHYLVPPDSQRQGRLKFRADQLLQLHLTLPATDPAQLDRMRQELIDQGIADPYLEVFGWRRAELRQHYGEPDVGATLTWFYKFRGAQGAHEGLFFIFSGPEATDVVTGLSVSDL